MQRIRVVVGKMPRLLREIILTSLSRQDDLEVVDAAETGSGLNRWLDTAGAGFLVRSSEHAELTPEEEKLMRDRPRLRILAINGEGRQGVLYEAAGASAPRKRSLHELSIERLGAAIRDSAASDETDPEATGSAGSS